MLFSTKFQVFTENTKNNHLAFEKLLNMIKEFELIYNLSPKLTVLQKKILYKAIIRIFN
jgi:hypothetical protein